MCAISGYGATSVANLHHGVSGALLSSYPLSSLPACCKFITGGEKLCKPSMQGHPFNNRGEQSILHILKAGVPTIVVIPLPQSCDKDAHSRWLDGFSNSQPPGNGTGERIKNTTYPNSVQSRAGLEDRQQLLVGQLFDKNEAAGNFEVQAKT